jgi:hypothetical protein
MVRPVISAMVMFIASSTDDERKKVKLPVFGFGKTFSSLPSDLVLGPPNAQEVAGITVSVSVVLHPKTVYEMVVTPAVRPATSPIEPIVATEISLLVHVPPVVASDNVMLVPAHKLSGPLMPNGRVFTVSTVVAGGQPETV